MLNNTTPANRTGHIIQTEKSPVEIVVVSKSIGSDVYVCQDRLKDDHSQTTGAYFVSGGQLENMIEGYATGKWAYDL